jgi:hypothetical protein
MSFITCLTSNVLLLVTLSRESHEEKTFLPKTSEGIHSSPSPRFPPSPLILVVSVSKKIPKLKCETLQAIPLADNKLFNLQQDIKMA